MHDGTDRIAEVFEHLDSAGGPVVVAEAILSLGNGTEMTVRAGGLGDLSSPARPPFSSYEVFLDHDPARFWRRYTDDDQLLYRHVPRMLVTHHVVRHGGIVGVEYSSSFIPAARSHPSVRLPITTVSELAGVLSDLIGRPVDAAALRW